MQGDCISIIIVNWNTKDFLLKLIGSIKDAAGSLCYETIVVDNASSDGSIEAVRKEFPSVYIIENQENIGFGGGNNLGLKESNCNFVAFVNPDVILGPLSLEILVNFLKSSSLAGLVGPKIILPDGLIQSEPCKFPSPLSGFLGKTQVRRILNQILGKDKISNSSSIRKCDYIHGSCMVAKREALEKIGVFPNDTFMYGEEILLGYRIKNIGYFVYYNTRSEILHFDDAPSDQKWTQGEKFLEKKKSEIIVNREIFHFIFFAVWLMINMLSTIARFIACKITKNAKHKYYRALIGIYIKTIFTF